MNTGKKIFLCFLASTLILATLALSGGPALAAMKPGGILRYAVIDSPPTLDQHAVTSDLSTTIAQHWSEGLYAYNAKYEPAPLLAKSDEVQDGGKLVIIQLREGVPFHNGKEMTSEDVVASLKRWGEHGVRGPIVFKHVDRLEAAGKYTVKIYFKEVFSPWKSLFACINASSSNTI